VGRVLLAGDLGGRDPGDDAMLAAFDRELPRWRLVLTSADPGSTAHRHGHPAVSATSPRAVLAAVRDCDVLVLGDGALRGAGARSGERGRDVLAIAVAAKALGRRLALLGVGAGELRRPIDRARVGALVRWSDLLVLRDAAAAEVLAEAGAPGPFRVGADPAWCALDPSAPVREGRDEVLVILDSRAALPGGPAPARLAAALDLLAARGLRVRLAPWRISRYGADDLDLARAISARLGARARILLPPGDLPEARAEATRARVVLALRLHALVIAAGAGTPVVAIDGEREMANLAARLGQPALPIDADPAAIAAAVLGAAHGPAPSPAAVRAERAAAHESFRLLRVLLEAEHSVEDHHVVPLPLAPETWRQAL
jgi:polysaccharide pyruvyl transferase WcaK-like protein